ncbi:MAG: RNA polymerase II transcription factor B subunit 1 [Chrysothrix sp. TS-e1954]|nr:MAG: RNA polymerase II transcription factor B subunit 1 [Chrysothrix sp. TS-e1954]
MDRPPAKRQHTGNTPEPKRPKKTTTSNATAAPSSTTTAPPPKKDEKLNPEIELQRSLLRSSPSLSRRFAEALRERPADISQKQLARQFWAQRQHLLRAHTIELEQKRAAYNVFSQVQPRHAEGVTKLNITPEQVEDIFRQHPVVRRAYDETVPGKFRNDMGFWSAFFVSRLFKRLKGERIMDSDPTDAVLDKYMNSMATPSNAKAPAADDTSKGQQAAEQHIPHFMDLSGNEQHHSQKLGNRPDFLMRPSRADKVPILHILNNMSEKIMAHVAPADGDPHAPIGMDEETFNELRLKDLQAEEGDDRMILNIRAQDGITGTSAEERDRPSAEALAYAKQDPSVALQTLSSDLSSALHPNTHELDLVSSTGFSHAMDGDDDGASDSSASSDSDDPKSAPSKPTNTFHTTLRAAQAQIQSLIAQHLTSNSSTTATILPSPLPTDTQTNLTLTHHTTNEFLHYFWTTFLSLSLPNPATSASTSNKALTPQQSSDLNALISTLSKSLDRISAAVSSAEAEKQERIKKLRKEAAEKQQRLANKRKVKWEEMGEAGTGGQEVSWLMNACVGAVNVARERYGEVVGKA